MSVDEEARAETERQHAFAAGYRAAQGYTNVTMTPKCQDAYACYIKKTDPAKTLQDRDPHHMSNPVSIAATRLAHTADALWEMNAIPKSPDTVQALKIGAQCCQLVQRLAECDAPLAEKHKLFCLLCGSEENDQREVVHQPDCIWLCALQLAESSLR